MPAAEEWLAPQLHIPDGASHCQSKRYLIEARPPTPRRNTCKQRAAAFRELIPGPLPRLEIATELRHTMHISSPSSSIGDTPRRAWWVVGVLTLTWLFAYLDRLVLIILTPAIRHDLSITDTQVSLLQGASFSIFFAVAGIPLGWAADRTNRRNLLLAGALLWTAMTALCGLAQTYGELFAARIGLGIGEGCLVPASFSLLADLFKPAQRGRAIGFVYLGAPLGTSLSAIGAGAILSLTGEAMVQVPVLGPLAPWRVVLLCASAASLVASLLLLTVQEPARPTVVHNGPVATLAESSFASYFRQHAGACCYMFGAFTLLYVAMYPVAFWTPVVLMRIFHLPVAKVGFIHGIINLITAGTGSVLGGLVSDVLARRRPLDGRFIGGFIAVPMTFSVVLLAFSTNLPGVLAGYALVLLCSATAISMAFGALQEMYPDRLRGQAFAVNQLLGNVLGGLAPTAVAFFTDYVFRDDQKVNWSIGVVAIPALAVSALLIALGLRAYRRTKAGLQDPQPELEAAGAAAGS
jgi:MFS family permease